MSNFHSTMSRRSFMKVLGLAGAGLGAAAASAPVFHDLDEVLSTPNTQWKNPWWVKERDYENPTVEVDWDIYPVQQIRDSDWRLQEMDKTRAKMLNWYGTDDRAVMYKNKAQEGLQGMSLRDHALNNAVNCVDKGHRDNRPPLDPADLGVPKWQGTPEENLHMLRVASRFFGSYWSGAVHLTTKTKKIVGARRDGRRRNVVFRDVEQEEHTDTEVTLPNGFTQAFVWIIQHPQHALSTAPGRSNNPYGYFFTTNTSVRIRQFIQNLGYKQDSSSVPSGSFVTLGGVTEMCRQGSNVVVPSHGAMPRTCNEAFTDLPLPYTKPVDAGIFKFCKSCKKCAEVCPTGSLSMEDEPSWEVVDRYIGIGGLKHYYSNYETCSPFKSSWAPGYCGTCMAICVFRNFNDAPIHTVVQSVAATTTIFNGFFREMDDVFGYRKNLLADKAHTNDDYVNEFWNTIGPEHGFYTHFGSHG